MDDILSRLDVEGLKTQLLGSSISVAEATGLMSPPPTLESYRSSFLVRGFQDAQVGGSVDRGDDSLVAAQIQHQFPMERGLPLLQSVHPGDTNAMLSTPSMFSLPASSLGLTLDSRWWHLGEMSNSNNGTNPLCFRGNMDETRGRDKFNTYAAPRPSVPGLQQANTSQGARPINQTTGALSPRVRARRGQATDPHSIAERKRREKIAKMTRDLQVLLPNANKTDKAIMLDEVIEYVKFLQLQMKVFGINLIGSSPSFLPSEYSSSMASSESLVDIERQVIQLMDENMDAALQFLQSNGFFLMPISMAAAHQCHQSGDNLEMSLTIATELP